MQQLLDWKIYINSTKLLLPHRLRDNWSGLNGGNDWKLTQIYHNTNDIFMYADKNTKEAFLKKLKLCMQNFDYKDETKDVKGKVRLH